MSTKVFLLGSSGFLGGTILNTLSQPNYSAKYDVTALVRGKESAEQIQKAYPKTKVIVGSLDDTTLVEELSAASDATINAADSDHVGGAAAIIAGLKKHKEVTGNFGVYVHVSGAASLADDAKGLFTDPKIYEDSDLTDFWNLPETVFHRPVDKLVADAGKDIHAYIVCPPWIYGGVSRGAIKRLSMGFPPLLRAILKIGQSCNIGEGLAGVSGVHVEDLTDFVLLLLGLGLQNDPRLPTGRDAFWYTSTDNILRKELTTAVGKRLFARGLISTPETRSFTDEEKAQHLGAWADLAFGSNMRCKSVKAFELGWKPKYGGGANGILSDEVLDSEINSVL